MIFRFLSDPETRLTGYFFRSKFGNGEKANCREKRPRILSTEVDLISSSPTTTDLPKASDAEVGEDEKKKYGKTLEALRQATYLSKSVNAAKLNTSEIFEPLQHFSENEEDRPFIDTAGQDGGEGIGCFSFRKFR